MPFGPIAGNPAMMPFTQFPLPTAQPQVPQSRSSRGVRAYPNGWRQVLNHAKDIVCSSVLLQEPFPRAAQARVTITECFHEATMILCDKGVTLEPGMSCI